MSSSARNSADLTAIVSARAAGGSAAKANTSSAKTAAIHPESVAAESR